MSPRDKYSSPRSSSDKYHCFECGDNSHNMRKCPRARVIHATSMDTLPRIVSIGAPEVLVNDLMMDMMASAVVERVMIEDMLYA